MTTPNLTGLAAGALLDGLTASDFEPEVEIDTEALDATIEALAAARELVARLQGLGRHLAAGGDAETARGLGFDVRVQIEVIDGLTAGVLA